MIEVQAFMCEHCERKVYRHRSSARSHEARCMWNPSRRACIRQSDERLATLFPYLAAAGCLKINWIEEILQIAPLPLLESLNALGAHQGFQVVRAGDSLVLQEAEAMIDACLSSEESLEV